MFNGVLPFHVSCTDCWYDKGRCMNLSTIFYLIMPMTLGYFSFVRWRKSNLDLTKDNATEHPWLASTHPQASSSDELRRVRTSSASAMITSVSFDLKPCAGNPLKFRSMMNEITTLSCKKTGFKVLVQHCRGFRCFPLSSWLGQKRIRCNMAHPKTHTHVCIKK